MGTREKLTKVMPFQSPKIAPFSLMVDNDRFRTIFWLLSFAAGLAAVYHLVGALGHLPYNRSPIWRHTLFVAIDVAASFYLIHRPIWPLPLFIALTIQQSWSHGAALYDRWQLNMAIDWLSLAVLAGLYAGLALLIFDAKHRLYRSDA